MVISVAVQRHIVVEAIPDVAAKKRRSGIVAVQLAGIDVEGVELPCPQASVRQNGELVGEARAEIGRATVPRIDGPCHHVDKEAVVQGKGLPADAKLRIIPAFAVGIQQPGIGLLDGVEVAIVVLKDVRAL